MTDPLDAMTTPFSLSLLTATRGNTSKRLIPDVSGRPIKDPAHNLSISAGRIEHVQVLGLTGLCDLLQGITHKQALVHGIPKESQPGDIFSLVTHKHYTRDAGTMARTLDCIDYPPGCHLLMFDYDPDPDAARPVESAADLMQQLSAVWPAFTRTGWVATVSTSSAIRDKTTRQWLTPPHGFHLYLLVTGDVARFKALARVRLWLAGTGWCKLTTPNRHTGVAAVLERCLVDLSVLSPERLDYVAGALISPNAPFYQDRPRPTVHPGQVIDLDTLPDVSREEQHKAAQLIAEAKARIAPERHRLVHDHIRQYNPALPDVEVTAEVTARIAQAERGKLPADFSLYFHRRATILRVRDLTASLDGCRLADPLEPTYRDGTDAIFHWNSGNWRVVSWAHGMVKRYRALPCTPLPDPDEPWPDAPPVDQDEETYAAPTATPQRIVQKPGRQQGMVLPWHTRVWQRSHPIRTISVEEVPSWLK